MFSIIDLSPINTGIIKFASTACFADSIETCLTALTITAFAGPFVLANLSKFSGQIIFFLLISKKNIICPENLLKLAKTKGPAKAVIVNAVKQVSIESAKQAVDANLIIPVFIGDKSIIENNAKQLSWDIF